jgi:hypothetical protein
LRAAWYAPSLPAAPSTNTFNSPLCREGCRRAPIVQSVVIPGLRRRAGVWLSLRVDPVRPDPDQACRHAGHPFHRLGLGFKGGKGVATYIGVLIALAWPAGIAFCLIWLAVAALTRYSSLAALTASLATPFLLLLLGRQPEAVLFTLLTVLIFIMHRANIARLINRTEGKIGKSASAGA